MDRGCKLSGGKRIRVHDLRHSHVVYLIEQGFSSVVIAERLGHESISITLNYAHLYPSKQLEIIETIEKEIKFIKMSKIFKRESLQSKGRKLKVDKNRKRNIIVNFRMSPEEKSLFKEKIALSGLNKQDYMIQMSLNHSVEVSGNIRVFDELKTRLKMLEEYFKNVNLDCDIKENKLELLAYILEMFETVNRNKNDSNYGNR